MQVVELPQWAIAAVISIVIVAFGTFLTKFGKHSEVTISGPVEIRVLQEADKRLENQMNKGFQEMKDLSEAQEGRMHDWKNQILEKLGTMAIHQERLGWRLDSVEKELQEIRDKRIAVLEKELRELNNSRRKNGDRTQP